MFHCSAFTTPGRRNRGTVVRACRLEANSSSLKCPEESRAIDLDYLAARPNNHEKTALKENIKEGGRQVRWAGRSCVITGPQETSQPRNKAGCRRLQIVTKVRSRTSPQHCRCIALGYKSVMLSFVTQSMGQDSQSSMLFLYVVTKAELHTILCN